MRKFLLTAVLPCCFFAIAHAQSLVKTQVSRSAILIGDQFTLTIEAAINPGANTISWPVLPESMAHFEVVNTGKLDSLYTNKQLSGLAQTFTITSFDSGKWSFPSLVIKVQTRGPAPTASTYFTDTVPITVSFSTSDTTNVLKDIKPIREAERISNVWYWVGGGLLLAALTALVTWYLRRKKKMPVTDTQRSRLSPYDEALKELEALKAYQLAVPADAVVVHHKLAEILKRFLTRSQAANFMNKTTGDILILLRDQSLNTGMLAKAASCLRCSDAVKFAKYQPGVIESENSLLAAREVINVIQLEMTTPKK